ncbi:hypothetical protein WME76_02120 [Sorangium sp. So ce119]|uniref:hypothetical protein n=1 Tax=Sorangium sp. So ce119 TaxID=3133279 RepID=UPI003F6411BE
MFPRRASAERPTSDHCHRLAERMLAEARAAEEDLKRELDAAVAERRRLEQCVVDFRAVRDAVPPPAPCEGCAGSGRCAACAGSGADATGAICGCLAGRCRLCGGTGARAAAAATEAP